MRISEDLLKITVLELTGIMKRLTPSEIAKAVRKPSKSWTIKASPASIVGKSGP
tara:strand:+ start:178 stop:339 length:162 start_codon:yes stop_codon:yes gene_type:complete